MTFPGAAEAISQMVRDSRDSLATHAAANVVERFAALEDAHAIRECRKAIDRIEVVIGQVRQACEKRDWKRGSAVAMAFGISIGATQLEAAKPAMVQLSTMAKDLQPGSFCEPIAEEFCRHLATMAKDLADDVARLSKLS